MSDSDELLGKADAFLNRFRPSASRDAAPEDIPVLTDVVAVADEVAAVAGEIVIVTDEAPVDAGGLTRAQVEEIEARLRTRVLESIGPYIENFLDEPLRIRLEASLRHALTALTGDVKADIELLVRDAVAKAVEHELARLREPGRDESR